MVWNIAADPAPSWPAKPIILHLAGQTAGDFTALAENRLATLTLCRTAFARQAAHVFVMSSAAVYPPTAGELTEDTPPHPPGDYGKAKLAAEVAAQSVLTRGLTLLRLGNLAGADMLLTQARRGPVLLDPVAGQSAGPERSYIGPRVLARVLAALIAQTSRLPAVLNLAQAPALGMADLLNAAGADWNFGPPRAGAVARVALSVDRLAGLVDLPPATAESVVADLASMAGIWP
jgi:nucleoside-diphosphate-sugar epimerase